MASNSNTNWFDRSEILGSFPALRAGSIREQRKIFFDAVGGTQVPERVIQAIGDHLLYHCGNKGGVFEESRETDRVRREAREAIADFINAPSQEEIIFGKSFTELTMSFSRAISKLWKAGDNIILSRLDHNANICPWVRAAEDVGIEVRYVDITEGDCLYDMDMLEELIDANTALVAVCAASSGIGSTTDIKRIGEIAHAYQALLYVDAVAYAPHAPIDVQSTGWNADFVGLSAYKFFGPHVAALWGRRELLEEIPAYKIQPAPEIIPGKWSNGADPYELLAGVVETIRYLEDVGERHPDFEDQYSGLFSGTRLKLKSGM